MRKLIWFIIAVAPLWQIMGEPPVVWAQEHSIKAERVDGNFMILGEENVRILLWEDGDQTGVAVEFGNDAPGQLAVVSIRYRRTIVLAGEAVEISGFYEDTVPVYPGANVAADLLPVRRDQIVEAHVDLLNHIRRVELYRKLNP